MTHRTLALAVLLIASPALARSPGYIHSPVVTHTNGMRIASTTSLRSHDAYWRCEAGHHGYCDGQLRSPCRDEWATLGTRQHGVFVPRYTPSGATSGRTHRTPDGLEFSDGETLGLVAPRSAAGGAATPPAPFARDPAAAPILSEIAENVSEAAVSQPGTWVDTLQTISQKAGLAQ